MYKLTFGRLGKWAAPISLFYNSKEEAYAEYQKVIDNPFYGIYSVEYARLELNGKCVESWSNTIE